MKRGRIVSATARAWAPLAWAGHREYVEGGVELLRRDLPALHVAAGNHDGADGLTTRQRLVGDLSRGLVADVPVQRGDDDRRRFDQAPHPVGMSRDPGHAAISQQR